MELKRLTEKIPYKWRVNEFSKHRPMATCVSYIDARDVAKHLDECLGPMNWQSDYKMVGDLILCGIGVKDLEGNWVWKWDTGAESRYEKEKGIVSDSFKRAAVKWGVGRFLYENEMQFVSANEKKTKTNHPYVIDGSGKRIYDLTEYINNVMKSKSSVEDKKYAAYWIDMADHCTSYKQQVAWYNQNQGNIGKYLDDTEIKKFLSYMTQMKKVFLEKEKSTENHEKTTGQLSPKAQKIIDTVDKLETKKAVDDYRVTPSNRKLIDGLGDEAAKIYDYIETVYQALPDK